VWTGSEVIVWGGVDQNFLQLNTGGRYNPDTDSWVATSITNAPDGRYAHTAIWTTDEMIVWGGSGFMNFNTGARYNPDGDSWTATSTANAPDRRYSHTAVWTGSEMNLPEASQIYPSPKRASQRNNTTSSISNTAMDSLHFGPWRDSPPPLLPQIVLSWLVTFWSICTEIARSSKTSPRSTAALACNQKELGDLRFRTRANHLKVAAVRNVARAAFREGRDRRVTSRAG
jgi:hypothetical protein